MQDELRPDFDAFESLEGATPAVFRRVLTQGMDERSRQDAAALAGELTALGRMGAGPEDADLIVLGSGVDAIEGRVALDQTGRDLLEGARCPVAVAPRGFARREDREIRRIEVGVDGSREASAAVTLAARFAHARSARLSLVAVAELAFDLGGKPDDADPREVERLGRRLDGAADGLAGIWVETELHEGLPDQILVGLAREADLLVLGSRATYADAGRVSLGSTAERVTQGAPCPVLIAPAR